MTRMLLACSIFLALPVHRARCISSSAGSWMTMFWAVLMIRRRAFLPCETQAAVQCVMKESMAHLEKLMSRFCSRGAFLKFEGSGTSWHPFWALETGWVMKWPTPCQNFKITSFVFEFRASVMAFQEPPPPPP